MRSINRNFKNCKDILEQLKGPNLVLTGSCILEAYGLYLHKESEDLDVVIYMPTDKQKEVINSLKDRNIANNEGLPEEYARVIKLKLDNGTVIDIIVEFDDECLLSEDIYLKYKGYNFQPINLIIQARNRYMREKDREACSKLKELNFNSR